MADTGGGGHPSDLTVPLLDSSKKAPGKQGLLHGIGDIKVEVGKTLPHSQYPDGQPSPTSHFFKDGLGGDISLPSSPLAANELGEDFDPFFHHNSCGVLPTFEAVLCLPLVVIRIAILLLLGVVVLPCFFFPLIGATDTLIKPYSKLRRSLLWPARLCARVLLFCLGYQWIHVVGKPAPRDVAPIVVSNHLSFVDPVWCFYYLLPIILSAKENAGIPIIGTLLKACQIIPVDRRSVESRRIATEEILKRSKDNRWPHIMIFPEGTTTNGRAIVSFKLGAFAPKMPVQPMVVQYPGEVVNPAWIRNGPPIHVLLFRLMFRFHNRMTVTFLPVASPTKEELDHPQLFAERVRGEMASALNVPLTSHTFWGASRTSTAP